MHTSNVGLSKCRRADWAEQGGWVAELKSSEAPAEKAADTTPSGLVLPALKAPGPKPPLPELPPQGPSGLLQLPVEFFIDEEEDLPGDTAGLPPLPQGAGRGAPASAAPALELDLEPRARPRSFRRKAALS
ncbi:unnamed protein product [Effrenium voratum]|uniref:Uncharacterized protein n=1 Tax=Effrenium voratum TaxID=2562239 RepID=A0AA36IA65_9DINO|nr:unnamed protein product [Effrenium voratum]